MEGPPDRDSKGMFEYYDTFLPIFDRDMVQGLEEVEKMLTQEGSTFDEFITQQHTVVRKCTCTKAWSKSTLVGKCKQCALAENAIVCLSCLLGGDHKDHDVMLRHSGNGSCDCGDNRLWKESGNCKVHAGQPENPENEVPEEVRSVLISGSMAAFKAMPFCMEFQSQSFILALKWLQRIVLIGDGMRRCIVIALEKSEALYEILDNVLLLEKEDVGVFYEFLGNLISDRRFRRCFSYTVVTHFKEIIHTHLKLTASANGNNKSKNALANSTMLVKFMFHGVEDVILNEYIGTIGWEDIVMKSLCLLDRFLWNNPSTDGLVNGQSQRFSSYILHILEEGLKQASEETIRNVCEAVVNFMLPFELKWMTARKMGDKADNNNYDNGIYHVQDTLLDLVDVVGRFAPSTNDPLEKVYNLLTKSVGPLDSCVLCSNNAKFTMSYALHLLAFKCTGSNNIKRACSEILPTDCDYPMKIMSVMPLRYLFAQELSYRGFFVRNTDDLLQILTYFKHRSTLKINYFPVFRLVQTCLMNVDDKDSFIFLLASIAGVFEKEGLDQNDRKAIMFVFMHFLCCLIYDRMILNNDEKKMRRLAIMTMLKVEPMSLSNICQIWTNTNIYDDEFIADLMSYSQRIRGERETLFRISNSSEWHPLLAYLPSTHISTTMDEFIDKNPGALIPFPELPPELKSVLVEPLVLAICFVILQDSQSSRETVHLVLNMFVHAAREYPDDEHETKDVIEAAEIQDLSKKLVGIPFKTIVYTKIAYEGKEPVSIFDLLVKMNDLGRLVISRMNLTLGEVPVPTSNSNNNSRVKMLRSRILGDFVALQNSFNTEPVEELDENMTECMICHCKNECDFLIYPALVYKTAARCIHIRKTRGKQSCKDPLAPDQMAKICIHACHKDCQDFSKHGKCSIDGCPFNTGLPCIDGMEMEAVKSNPEIMKSCRAFLDKFNYPNTHPLVSVISGFSCQIEMLDLRYRRNPRCLDDPATAILLRNFWLCISAVYKEKCQDILRSAYEIYGEVSSLNFTIIALIAQADRHRDLADIMKKILFDPPEFGNTVYEVLRAVALIEHFCMLRDVFDGKTKDRDWDEILSGSNLFKRYGLPEGDTQIYNFNLIDLPKNFLGFLTDPFFIDIANNDNFEIIVDLLAGHVGVIPKRGVHVTNMQSIASILTTMGSSFSLFLIVTGHRATSIVIGNLEFNCILETKTCYVDKFGDEDKGFKVGRFVSPSPDRLDWLTDQILSGNWSNALTI